MGKKIAKIAVLTVLTAILLVSVVPMLYDWYLFARVYPRQSQELLSRANTIPELMDAVGQLGTVFEFRDGSWFAVRYQDTHAMPGHSLAIARDSRGVYYRSNYHFCGRLAELQSIKMFTMQWEKLMAGKTDHHPAVIEELDRAQEKLAKNTMHALEESAGIDEALGKMDEYGFEVMPE